MLFSSCEVDIDRVVCIDRGRLVLRLSLLSQINMHVVFTMTMTWLMALCEIFLLLELVFKYFAL